MNKKPHVAIVGATGAVGREMLNCLEERNFPLSKITLLASARSAGKPLEFREKELTVEELTPESFHGIDIALFSAGGSISKEFAPIAANTGCIVIDNSSAFRMDPDVPLILPEINGKEALNPPPQYHRKPELLYHHHFNGTCPPASGLWFEGNHCLNLSSSLGKRRSGDHRIGRAN
ncbi:hypothetical protein N9198_03770 [Akkermansiaceae bacterium]|nr:hypothetical protein [Akkermansiaceae bacterium]